MCTHVWAVPVHACVHKREPTCVCVKALLQVRVCLVCACVLAYVSVYGCVGVYVRVQCVYICMCVSVCTTRACFMSITLEWPEAT